MISNICVNFNILYIQIKKYCILFISLLFILQRVYCMFCNTSNCLIIVIYIDIMGGNKV